MKIPKNLKEQRIICMELYVVSIYTYFCSVVQNDNSFPASSFVYGCVFKLTLTFKEFQFDSMNLSSALNYAYNESKKERKEL